MNNSPVTQSQVIRVALIIIMLALIYKAGMMFVANVNYDTNYYLNIGINFVEHGELTPLCGDSMMCPILSPGVELATEFYYPVTGSKFLVCLSFQATFLTISSAS